MRYEKLLAAQALENHGAPPRAVDVWQDEEKLFHGSELELSRSTCLEAFLPREERKRPMLFLHGGTGTGKTVTATVGLGETLAEAFRRQRAGGLDMSRARGHLQRVEVITPERVRRVLGLDWETYQANERLQPGVCAAQVREAYAQEQAWDFELCPLSFSFWEAAERARRSVFGKEAEAELEHARTCDVLVLDDLGAESGGDTSPWRAIVDEVVNARYAHSLVTVLTTNMPIVEFCRRYRQRVVDRVIEAGTVREMLGQSRRGGKR